MHIDTGNFKVKRLSNLQDWLFTRILHVLSSEAQWVVPENIHTHTTGGISEFGRGGGVTSTGIPRTWGGYVEWNSEDMGGSLDWNSEGIRGFQESNFQFGVVKSLQEKLVKNDLSKDDDSLINTRHVQLNQHAGDTFQWSWSIKCLC